MHSFHKAKPSKTSSVHLTNFNGIARPLKMHILHAGVIVNTPSGCCELMGCRVQSQFTLSSTLYPYSGIKDPVAKMKSILQDYYLCISPHMTPALPPPKKYVRFDTSTQSQFACVFKALKRYERTRAIT